MENNFHVIGQALKPLHPNYTGEFSMDLAPFEDDSTNSPVNQNSQHSTTQPTPETTVLHAPSSGLKDTTPDTNYLEPELLEGLFSKGDSSAVNCVTADQQSSLDSSVTGNSECPSGLPVTPQPCSPASGGASPHGATMTTVSSDPSEFPTGPPAEQFNSTSPGNSEGDSPQGRGRLSKWPTCSDLRQVTDDTFYPHSPWERDTQRCQTVTKAADTAPENIANTNRHHGKPPPVTQRVTWRQQPPPDSTTCKQSECDIPSGLDFRPDTPAFRDFNIWEQSAFPGIDFDFWEQHNHPFQWVPDNTAIGRDRSNDDDLRLITVRELRAAGLNPDHFKAVPRVESQPTFSHKVQKFLGLWDDTASDTSIECFDSKNEVDLPCVWTWPVFTNDTDSRTNQRTPEPASPPPPRSLSEIADSIISPYQSEPASPNCCEARGHLESTSTQLRE